jgi:hypothetical protein
MTLERSVICTGRLKDNKVWDLLTDPLAQRAQAGRRIGKLRRLISAQR